MEDKIPFEQCIGDAIVKEEVVTYKQMNEEINQENLFHVSEMTAEMKNKWNKERRKYFETEYENPFFPNELSVKSTQEVDPHPERSPEFQKKLHEECCIAMNMKMCFACCREDI